MGLNLRLSLKYKRLTDLRGRSFYVLLSTLIITIFTVTDALTTSSSQSSALRDQLNYRTFFGSCPSRAAGTLTMDLVEAFEESGSLRSLKQRIVEQKLDEKHFVSSYQIEFDPYDQTLFFRFECPEPLMKVQIYREGSTHSYKAVLVEGGELYDPTYEVLLRTEEKLDRDLPYLAIPVGEFDNNMQNNIADLIMRIKPRFRKNLAEVILNENNELTMILSIYGHPSSVFMGERHWPEKIEKLQRIISFMGEQDRVPSIINLTNSKKVVVKFND